jgi:hypothetical protein
MTLTPETHGAVPIRSASQEFLQRFRQRVDSGLLTGRPHPRSNYVVTQADTHHLHVRAADWWTAINVGLNELDLELPQGGIVRYQVHYWRWTAYAIGLCGVLGLIGLVLLLTFDVRTYITQSPGAMIPGLSVDQNVIIAWAMVLFWGFVWPWLLVLLHKRPLQRLVTRLITEVDQQASPAARG